MPKSKRLVIFGTGDMAEVAHEYFQADSEYNVVGFTVDAAHLRQQSFRQVPVVPFEEVAQAFPSDTHELFIALGYSQLNAVRQGKFEEAIRLRYRLASYISSRATILNGGRFGRNCFILEDNTVQSFVEVGENVVMWSGNHVGHHSTIGDHCFIASHAVISGRVHIGERCFIGVNVTIRDNVIVGPRCVLGAGTLLLADAESDGVYSPEATERSRVPSNRLRRI